MRCLAFLAAFFLLAACSTRLDGLGREETTVNPRFLFKTEVDRIADANRREVVDGLLRVADKLYKRNPQEWKKSGAASREAALIRLRDRHYESWPALQGQRERHAAALAFSESFAGDRVAALVFGLLTMVDAAFEGKDDFYFLDSLNEQKLFNAARNMDVAVWKLSNDRTASGSLFLISNELDPLQRNLSFEREFGRLMGLLDFMAVIIADRNGRTLSRLSQSMATVFFLPVGL